MEGRKKVLYVEDSNESFLAVDIYLKQLGYELIKPKVETLASAKKLIESEEPEIILMDLDLPKEGPDKLRRMKKVAEYISALKENKPNLTIIVHSAMDNLYIEVVRLIVGSGISYLAKEAVTDEKHLERAISHARTGGAIYDHQVVNFFGKMLASAKETSLLTAREWDVAALIADKSNYEIGQCLGITQARVGELVSSILRKLNFKSRTQIAVWYQDQMRIGYTPTPPNCIDQ